jgi:hypothetical protein
VPLTSAAFLSHSRAGGVPPGERSMTRLYEVGAPSSKGWMRTRSSRTHTSSDPFGWSSETAGEGPPKR